MKSCLLCASFSLALLPLRVEAQQNECPVVSDQTATVLENLDLFVRGSQTVVLGGVTNPILLNASDPDHSSLLVHVKTAPVHGVLFACFPGNGTYVCLSFDSDFNIGPTARILYVPDILYRGTDSFTYTASDGQCASAVATVSINIAPVNQTPAPVVHIEQLRVISGLGDVVIAPGGGPLHLKVDATGTIDDGPFPLQFDFLLGNAAGQQVLNNGVVCREYPENTPYSLVQVYVTDGAGATGFRQMFFNIHTPGEVIDALLGLIQGELFGIRNQRPYRAPLESAQSAFASGDTGLAIVQLQDFQDRVAARLSRRQPDGATYWIETIQWIIDSVTKDCCQ